MKRKALAVFVMICLMITLITVPGYALQDPVVFSADSVAYGDGQNTLIVKGFFINVSDRTAISMLDTQIEIKAGSTVIASETVDVSAAKVFSVGIGDAYPWTLILKDPVKGMPLTGLTIESSVSSSLAKAQELTAGKKVYYKGAAIDFDVKPAVIGGRLMIPARAVFEKMGATVTWDAVSKSLTVNRGNRQVLIFIDNAIMTVNGVATKLDVPATIVDGRTLVPLRAIATALGAKVIYGEAEEMAVVYE